jgi:CxxC motif-containing protein (DUF1111 family)
MRGFLTILLCLTGVASAQDAGTGSDNGFTVARADQDAYSQPAPVLSYRETETFLQGRSHFKRRWVASVAFNGEWGLGPTFIQTRCSECHVNNGRGGPPQSRDEQLATMLVRLSLPGANEHGGPLSDPNYGDQFQNRALQGESVDFQYSWEPVPAEAALYLDWEERSVTLPDGEKVTLRKPVLRIEKLAFGPLGEGAMTSLRNTPPLAGLGLLEAVPEETVLALAREQKKLGLNGRPNFVWDAINQRAALGRFGWKANTPSLLQQVASAFLGDIGVTSWIFRQQNCPPIQKACQVQAPGNDPEVIKADLDDLELWLRGSAVPAPRDAANPVVRRGAEMFRQTACDNCHVPELNTAAQYPAFPKLANRSLRAYTDLLVHDMGEDLADGRPDFQAGARDWRTAPLWGLGLSATVNGHSALLHDGRARNVKEAILWHGGEAAASRDAFSKLPIADRDALLKFVESI